MFDHNRWFHGAGFHLQLSPPPPVWLSHSVCRLLSEELINIWNLCLSGCDEYREQQQWETGRGVWVTGLCQHKQGVKLMWPRSFLSAFMFLGGGSEQVNKQSETSGPAGGSHGLRSVSAQVLPKNLWKTVDEAQSSRSFRQCLTPCVNMNISAYKNKYMGNKCKTFRPSSLFNFFFILHISLNLFFKCLQSVSHRDQIKSELYNNVVKSFIRKILKYRIIQSISKTSNLITQVS